jgi:hypothetical protein
MPGKRIYFFRQLFFETKIRCATKIIKNQGVIFNDNCCQFLMSIIVNSGILFVFALMKCSYAAFGEQNKTDNDSKCQQVYKFKPKLYHYE